MRHRAGGGLLLGKPGQEFPNVRTSAQAPIKRSGCLLARLLSWSTVGPAVHFLRLVRLLHNLVFHASIILRFVPFDKRRASCFLVCALLTRHHFRSTMPQETHRWHDWDDHHIVKELDRRECRWDMPRTTRVAPP